MSPKTAGIGALAGAWAIVGALGAGAELLSGVPDSFVPNSGAWMLGGAVDPAGRDSEFFASGVLEDMILSKILGSAHAGLLNQLSSNFDRSKGLAFLSTISAIQVRNWSKKRCQMHLPSEEVAIGVERSKDCGAVKELLANLASD